MERQADFYVEGLDCAEEVFVLREELEEAPGIQSLNFDVVRSRMTVTYDPAVTSPAKIGQRARRTGMTLLPWEDRTQIGRRSWWQTHGRLFMTALSGTALAAGCVMHGLIVGTIVAVFGYTGEAAAPFAVRLLYAVAMLAGVWYVAPKAWNSLRRLRPDMNLLMTIAVAGAVLIGQWFEAATVSFLFALALLLEQWSMRRTRRAVASLLDLSPPTAQCVVTPSPPSPLPEGEGEAVRVEVRERPIEDVPLGSTVLVRPHDRIPLDGTVLKGISSVNEAPITGESVPVSKQPGDEVFAGTINEDGTLEFEVIREACDTTLARIVHMIEEASSRRAPSEQWVETFARYYTPTMLALAVGIALLPPLLFTLSWSDWFYRALVLLVIACPCALVISTPVSIVSALTAAARHGVLVKGGRYLEAFVHLKVLALDKTGTLTHGRPVVQQIVALNGHSEDEVLQRAAAMEGHSQHPLARAILNRAHERGIAVAPAENYRVLSGLGAEGEFGGRPFWIGSHRLMHDAGAETPDIHEQAVRLEDAGHSVVALGNEEHVCGLIGVADEVRRGVAETIAAVKRSGVRHVVMLTGDNTETARAVAGIVGVDEFRAELLPPDKLREVESLRDKYGPVAMLGDGVNDAPAMAAADVGIAMGAIGSDAAIETADVALMADDLAKLPWLVHHARRTLRIIKENITFALGLKLLFVVLTFLGMASLWLAIAADTGATLLVILNALRLLRA